MSRVAAVLLLLSPLAARAQAPAASPAPAEAPAAALDLDLAAAYQLALARSEQIAISGADWRQALAQAQELWAEVMPQVTLMGTETFQDVPRGQSGLFLQKNREQGWVTLHQPLFSGLREFLAFRAAKRNGRSYEFRLERAKQLLYQDVARAYLDLLSAQDQILIRENVVDITRDRLKDLREFRRVGRSRSSELIAAESQLAQDLAQLETARQVERAAQFRLGFLTGSDRRLAPKDVPSPGEPPALDPLLGRARARPDVEARRDDAEAQELLARAASRRRWPTISADANYYFRRPPSFTSDVRWDATLTGSLPLYAGGGINAFVRENEAILEARRQALSLALRTAELETRTAREDLAASEKVVRALQNAATLADQNAKAQAEDYRLGQVTNLDVLGALNTLQQTRLTLDAARLDAYWARVRLEVAAGVPGGTL